MQENLDAALTAAGLADRASALSPTQRRQQGLVRRTPEPRPFPGWAFLVLAAVVILAGAALGSSLANTVEETKLVNAPQFFGGSWETYMVETRTEPGLATPAES